MTKKHNNKKTDSATVFECRAADAKSVFLAGSFNDWNPQSTPMEQTAAGRWETALELTPGRYEYKFIVDGNWCCEPGREDGAGCPNCVRGDQGLHCETCVPNAFGTMNRVLDMSAGHALSTGHTA